MISKTLAISDTKFPCEGPKGAPVVLEFSSAETKSISLFDLTYQNKVTFFVTLFVDNSENDQRLIIIVESTNQRIVVPANANGYVQVLGQNPAIYHVQLENNPVSPIKVKIHANNFSTQSEFQRVPKVDIALFPEGVFSNGEKGWLYDYSRLDSIFQDSALTVPATINSRVGGVLDLSGNGNHKLQAVAASRPTLRFDAGLGIYYLELTAGSQRMRRFSSNVMAGIDKFTMAYAIRNEQASAGVVFEHGVFGSLGGFGFQVNNPGVRFYATPNAGGSTPTVREATLALNSVGRFIMQFDLTAVDPADKISGTNNGSSFGAITSPGSGSGTLVDAAPSYLNNSFVSSAFLKRDYGGIVCGRHWTAAEKAQAAIWLAARSG